MHRTLRWEPIGIEQNLRILGNGLREKQRAMTENRTHDRLKFSHWIEKLDEITHTAEEVKKTIRSRIERDLGFPLNSDEMLILALFQPSTRNLFAEIASHFEKYGGCALSTGQLEDMAGIADAAASLAWIGDAALKIAVLPEIWTPHIREAGVLSVRRQEYEQNTNLARLCDRWDLYRHRIHFDPDVPKGNVDHVKGTLVEAILGIIFLEGGVKAVREAARLLAPEQT